MKTAIQIERLSKYYRLGVIDGGTLREDVNRWFSRMMGNGGKLPCYNGRQRGDLWALRDINLDIREGEVLGIIGANGAGKSTLLKIISSITTPTSGSVKIAGRVGSLLEVGTGFHPELTGRENIFLNGAILGMRRREISDRLDEIIAFSGVPEFIDTPIKRYSSGMKVRLAFAVAAHLEPEIMLVDEVLAVGDATFQKKCMGKMDEVSSSGRTIIFVSHSLSSIRRLCGRLVVLKDGAVAHDGDVDSGIELYLKDMDLDRGNRPTKRRFDVKGGDAIRSIEVVTSLPDARLFSTEQVKFRIVFDTVRLYGDLELNISFWEKDVKLFMFFGSELAGKGYNQEDAFESGNHTLEFTLPAGLLSAGVYRVNMALLRPRAAILHRELPAMTFEVLDDKRLVDHYRGVERGRVNISPECVNYSNEKQQVSVNDI